MAIEGQGCILFWSTTTSASTAISLGEVTGFNGPSGSAGIIDMTHLASTAKEKMMGLPDEGQITIDLNLVTTDSGQVKLRECRAARTKGSYILLLTDTAATRLQGEAYVSGFSITGSVDNIVKASVTLELTGKTTWTT